MTKKYELVSSNAWGEVIENIRSEDSETGEVWLIPIDEANSDYQAYLVWKAEQEN